MKKEIQTITLPLDEYLRDKLGDNHCVSIRSSTATIIEAKLKGNLTYKIQFPDRYSPDLEQPLLWRYSAWSESVELWERQRKRAHDDRVTRYLLDANIKIVARRLSDLYNMGTESATMIALSIVKDKTNMEKKTKHIGVVILTKESEL